MFSIMLFIFLCFFGILAVLYHMLRSQEKLCKSLHEEHAQMRVMLRSLESRLDDLDVAAPAAAAGNGATRLAPRPASRCGPTGRRPSAAPELWRPGTERQPFHARRGPGA